MNCSDSKLWLHADMDCELDAINSVELKRHLKTCPSCASEEQSMRSIKAALRDAPLRYDAPASLRKKVHGLGRTSGGEMQTRFNPLLFWKSLAFAASAFAVLAILLRPTISETDTTVNEAVANHVRSLQAEHLTDVASSDQHTVKPWFNGKLDFAPDVRDFTSQGFPLVGGRLDYLNGRAVAALVYQRNKHFINVFVWPSVNSSDGKMGIQKFRGYSIISHDAHGLHYCLVSDVNHDELTSLARFFDN